MDFNDKETILKGALELAKHNYKIFPVYGLDENGICTCKDQDSCRSPGKHPALAKQWQSKATNNISQIEERWKDNYNIGLPTGDINGILVLDIDGSEGLRYFEDKAVSDPKTVCQKTGKGYHYFYKYDSKINGEIKNRTRFKPDMDIRCIGGYVAVSPSNHYSGVPYQWINGPETPLTDIPGWLMEDLKEHKREERVLTDVGVKTDEKGNTKVQISEGKRNNTLFQIARKSHNLGLPHEDVFDEINKYNLKYCIPPLHDNEIKIIALSACGYLPRDDILTENSAEKLDQEADRIINEVWIRANKIMREEDPLKYVLDCFNDLHIGDRHIAEYILLMPANQMIKNSYGLHADIFGPTGMGKSDTVFKTFHLMPPNCYVVADMSNKALFYHPIPDKTILYIDDYKQSDEMDNIIRKTTSVFHSHSTYLTLDSNREAKELTLPSEISWIISSVQAAQDNQNLSRVVILNADDSTKTNIAVAEKQLDRVSKGEDQNAVTDEIITCRKIIEDFRRQSYIVEMPFIKDKDILNLIDTNQRRNINIFLDIIMSIAVWNWRKRDYDEETNILTAEEEDYSKALELWRIISGNTETKLTDAEINLIKAAWESTSPIDHVISTDNLKKALGISSGQISHLCNGKQGKNGLIDKVVGFEYGKITINHDGSDRFTKISRQKHYVDVRYLDGFIKMKLNLVDKEPDQNPMKRAHYRGLADEDDIFGDNEE